MKYLTKAIAFILCALQLFFCGISYGDYGEASPSGENKSEIINDIDGDSDLSSTIKLASEIKNQVQAKYTDKNRSSYEIKNSEIILTHSLSSKNFASITDESGNVYIADSFDTYFVDSSGKTYFSSDSSSDIRVNTIRLGEYYYDCRVRDFDFKSDLFKAEKAYHVYADRIYSQLSLYALEETNELKEFGSVVKIPADTVLAFQIKDKDGIHSDMSFDSSSVEYVAFDIKNVGIIGFIIPSDGSTKSASISLENGYYVFKQTASYTEGTGINKYDETGKYSSNCVTFGSRIYTDKTHSFDCIQKEAQIERNPLDNIQTEKSNSNAAFLKYDALRGAYTFRMDGTDFTNAYNNPLLQFKAPITITSDEYDRTLYIRMFSENGCLEAGALLDNTDTLVPVDVEVCKNFQGDGGEPFYSAKDYQYGDCFFPISIKAEETLSFTLLNLYQNWGNYPLKQLSSIEFHTSYYHLSTGTTESNCIAPYFVFGKDGWLLPDFRTRSGKIWSSQPQFNSVGILKFVNYTPKTLGLIEKETVLSEYVSSKIDSVGQTYSDITQSYLSDCGSYEYTLRHVEFPQTDENRTYYTVEINFLRDVTFANFKRDFDLFYFDGRYVCFNKAGYLDESNNPVSVDVGTEKLAKTDYYTLGSESPYFSFYDVTDETENQLENNFGCNFALIVRDSEITVGGEKSNIPLAFRETSSKSKTTGVLTLDTKKITFKAGDSIKLTLVLLPWGEGTEENDSQVLSVREDSALKPVTVKASVGTVKEDKLVPTVRCENNTAVFSVKGGKNNIAIRVDGFTELNCPEIYMNGKKLILSSSNGYDGYSVFYNSDGTYGFSFVYEASNPDTTYNFEIKQ